MRIISKFKDYYDIGLNKGVDKTIIYNRVSNCLDVVPSIRFDKKNETQIDEVKISKYLTSIKDSSRFELRPFYVGFCGKLYLGLRNHKGLNIYSSEDYQKLLTEKYLSNPFINTYKRSFGKYLGYEKNLLSHKNVDQIFDEFGVREIGDELFSEYNTPIFIIYSNFLKINWSFEINPMLKSYDFVKVFNPYSAFQEISMYISGVLGIGEKPIINISDRDMLYKHGFDKYSFKTSKGKKKK